MPSTEGNVQMKKATFSAEILKIDCEKEVKRIVHVLQEHMLSKLKRRGLIVAVSGGIDSSLTLALAVKAFGSEKVVALQMPERHSAQETLHLSSICADKFNVPRILEDISDLLDSVNFYQKYKQAIQYVIPQYDDYWTSKLVISNVLESNGYTIFSIVAKDPNGKIFKYRLPLNAYLEIVAATNFKQRIRKMLEYYHADRLFFAVAGTPNRLEYDQGFFVKIGDGAADVKPIAHLYKSQVYQMAEYLGVPGEILVRPPTTDTYSLQQGQDEFYFSLPYQQLDLCLYAKNHFISPELVSESTGLNIEQIELIYKDIDKKRSSTRYLHLQPLLIEEVGEIK
jgi:NAD+ synthase